MPQTADRRPQTADRRPPWSLLNYFINIVVFLAIALMATVPTKSQAWNCTGTGNGTTCIPTSYATWIGYVGIGTNTPAKPLHVHSGYCLSSGVYDPAIVRIQSQVASYGFGQSSLQFWSSGQGTNQDWQVASIKPITNATPTVFNTANAVPANWNGGLAFYCSGTGKQPVADGAEVMRIYDQRVAINSTQAFGRLDIVPSVQSRKPRFVFTTFDSEAFGPSLKMYTSTLGASGEYGDKYPLWMSLDWDLPSDLGSSRFYISNSPTATPIGEEEAGSDFRNNRFVITGSGNIGINQKTPDAMFQVTDGSILFDGDIGGVPKKWSQDPSSYVWTSSQIGAGTRMMWIPKRAAVRAGRLGIFTDIEDEEVDFDGSNFWDDDYVGSGTYPHQHIGMASSALGENVHAQAPWSVAIGRQCQVDEQSRGSVAMGFQCIVSNPGGFINNGHNSFALGHHSQIINSFDCLAMGYHVNIKSASARSVAMGRNITIQGAYDSFVFGCGQNEGSTSTDEVSYGLKNTQEATFNIGFNSKKPAFFVAGGEEESLSKDGSNVSQTSRVGIGYSYPINRLDVNGATVIGSEANGYTGHVDVPDNGLVVEGQTVIGTTAPSGTLALTVNGAIMATAYDTPSDRNLKKDITNFTDGLATLRQMNTVRFHYNGTLGIDSSKEHIGIIAQDIEKIAPYVVRMDTFISRKATTIPKYAETDEIDTTDGVIRKKTRFQPAEIKEERNAFLVYNPSDIQYIAINSIKQLDSTVTKLEKQVESLNSTRTSQTTFAKEADPYLTLEQRIKAIEDNIQQIQATCCKNTELYDHVLLEQNVPNPFSKETIITYFVPERLSGRIELIISDISGNTILQKVPVQANIPTQYTYASTDLQTGVYLYGISLNGQIVKSNKMMVIK